MAARQFVGGHRVTHRSRLQFGVERGDAELDDVRRVVDPVRRWLDTHYANERAPTRKFWRSGTSRRVGRGPTVADLPGRHMRKPWLGTGMASLVDVDLLATGSVLVVVAAALGSLYVVARLDESDGWGASLRSRFVLGVPWGTVVVVCGVVAVYLFVQGAGGDFTDPLVVPFRSWSYWYPLGMFTAPFAHGNLGHVTGNLLSTVVFAPVAEYAWSHYPTERGSQSFSSLSTNPVVRIAGFVVGVVLVGLVTSLFVPGPLIGFSGVVFAFAGFALVTRPLAAIFAIVAVRVVRVVYYGVTDPVVVAEARRQFVRPWFADVAIQGHALGLVVGVLLGAVVVHRRGRWPDVRYVWFATLVFGISESLYAFYWYAGVDRYLLFRGAGVAVVFVLVTLVAIAVIASDRRPVPWSELTGSQLAAGLLLAVVIGIGIAAVPYNLAAVDGVDGNGTVEVRDYTVAYVEDVPNGYVSAVSLPVVGDVAGGSARASGVVVTSERRNAWEEVVPAGRLALNGEATVSVGGLGWRERVRANRSGWNAVGAGSTYKVSLQRPGEPRRLAFADQPVRLAPTIAGLNLTIEPTRGGYALNGTRNRTTVERVRVPRANATVEVGDVSVDRRGDALFARHEDTEIRLAVFERDQRE